MWRLKDQAEGNSKVENALKIKEILEALKGNIDGLESIEVGINILESAQSFDVVLYSEFKDQKSLDDYQVHPKHVEAGSFIKKVCCERAVVDYNL